MEDMRVAVVSLNAQVFRISENLDRMAYFIKEAAKAGTQIICFPELSITGYLTGKGIEAIAIPIPGDALNRLQKLSNQHQMVVLAGLAEKNESGNIFATHLVIMPDRETGVYRKLHIAPPEKETFTQGNHIPVFEWNGFRFGVQLCYDAHFPELTTEMALKGVDAVFMPHASPRGTSQGKFDSWMRHLPARAFDNGIFVIACNQAGDNGNGLEFPGLSVVVGPSGEILVSEKSGQESMILHTLKNDDLEAVRTHRMRYFLPNRRPELYTHLL